MKALILIAIYISTTIATFALITHCTAESNSSSKFLDTNYQDWYYKRTKPFKGWRSIIIHHSATAAGSVKAFDNYHTKQGYGGVAYHFVIGNGKGMKDGEVQPTFRWKEQISGTHVSVNSWEHNIFGIGICLVGNLENSEPTAAQMRALKKLVARLQKQHSIPKQHILGHGDVPHDDHSGDTEQT
ncbi:MAG: N-acetylmuramoyl-L-alanine amidase [Bdellovibrionales bacterium]|nr:N-acetylmuramoyl-L-alanine amidase [Bdellovibrionales bacterium]